MGKIPKFPEQEYCKKIAVGSHAKIYAISDKYVAKVLRLFSTLDALLLGDDSLVLNCKEEFEIAKELYENGISVPKPIGVYKVKINKLLTLNGLFLPYRKAFVMERIYGVNGHETEGDLRKRIEKLQKIEVEKAREKKLWVGESEDIRNCIYVPEQDKVYLIDFQNYPMGCFD